MVYPADEEQAVFYNPVQVQNRDLSALMIALYAERKRTRQLVKDKTKELKKQQKEESSKQLSKEELADKIKSYEASIQNTVSEQLSSDKNSVEDGVQILDALAASGLRSIRYWKEVPGITHITINDLDPAAVERAHTNLERNQLTGVSSRDELGIRIRHGDATHEMYMSRRDPKVQTALSPDFLQQSPQYDVIDLDPYGSAAPFLDAAIQAVRDGGMLNVTCTDMVALGGSHPETCFGRYNASLPLQRAPYLQEVALRILLQSLATTAAKYGRSIRPVLSVGMDFYVRVFVEVHNDKSAVEQLSLSIGNIYQSTQCSSFYTIPRGQISKKKNVYQPTRVEPSQCTETGAPFKVGGPIWLGPLHDINVVEEAIKRLSSKTDNATLVLATKERLRGLLTTVSEELNDVPLFYTLPDICHVLGCPSPPMQQFQAALQNAGYRVSGYHKDPHAVKTDAPNSVIWDIMRVWCQANKPVGLSKKKRKRMEKRQQKKLQNNTDNKNTETSETEPQQEAGEKILAVPPSIEVDFKPKNQKKKSDVSSKVTRFPMNPEKHWGPKSRAVGKKRKLDANDRKNSQ